MHFCWIIKIKWYVNKRSVIQNSLRLVPLVSEGGKFCRNYSPHDILTLRDEITQVSMPIVELMTVPL